MQAGGTPLHLASIYGNLEAIQLFLRQGADVLKVDRVRYDGVNQRCLGCDFLYFSSGALSSINILISLVMCLMGTEKKMLLPHH